MTGASLRLGPGNDIWSFRSNFQPEASSKTRASVFTRASKHLETIKALRPRRRAFIRFSVLRTPDQNLALVFDLLIYYITDFSYKHGICSLCNGKCNFVLLPGWGICTHFKAPRGGSCINSPASPWGFCSFSKEKWQIPDKCAWGWSRF